MTPLDHSARRFSRLRFLWWWRSYLDTICIILLEGFHAFVYFGGGGDRDTIASFFLKVFTSSFTLVVAVIS